MTAEEKDFRLVEDLLPQHLQRGKGERGRGEEREWVDEEGKGKGRSVRERKGSVLPTLHSGDQVGPTTTQPLKLDLHHYLSIP